jgi:hypothetical protein
VTLRPLFLLSLPRSGSTLVQRVLAAHDEVVTAPEPWVLLPQVYAMRERGAYAEYGQVPATRAILEFAERLPGGRAAYEEELRHFVLALYGRVAGDRGTYFLDKTPRYHFIVEDLMRLFPEGRFIFLWRNPLAIVASVVETWGKGRWNVGRWRSDLFDGTANLAAGYSAHAQRSLAVRFEDLVGDALATWPVVFDHLGLTFDASVLTSFRDVSLDARMGDPTGTKRYDSLSTEPLNKWKRTLADPVRKRWCRHYLRWIGDERLALMGYSLGELLAELDAVPTRLNRIGPDLARSGYAASNRLGKRAAARLLWRGRGP